MSTFTCGVNEKMQPHAQTASATAGLPVGSFALRILEIQVVLALLHIEDEEHAIGLSTRAKQLRMTFRPKQIE